MANCDRSSTSESRPLWGRILAGRSAEGKADKHSVLHCSPARLSTVVGEAAANAVTDILYGYNNMGELASVTVVKESGVGSSETGVASTQYDAVGGTSTTSLPNTVYSYDFGGRFSITLDGQQFGRFGSNVALALAGVGGAPQFGMVLSKLAGFLGTLNSEIAGLVGGSAAAGVTAGLELIADRKDEVLGVYGFVGAAVGVSAGSGNVSTSIYDGVVWDVPKWTDYAGPFITVGGTVNPGMLGAGVSYFYSVKNPEQHGILTSLTQGARSGLGGSYTGCRVLAETGQGAGGHAAVGALVATAL